MFGQHYNPLQDMEWYSAEFQMDYEKFGAPKASVGLHHLIHLDVYHRHFEDRLDSRTMDKHLDLTEMDHRNWRVMSYHAMQYIRGLSEGPGTAKSCDTSTTSMWVS